MIDQTFLRDHFYYEVKRKAQLETAIAFLATILGLIGTALFKMVLEFPFGNDTASALFFIASTFCLAMLCLAIYFLIRGFVGYNYGEIPQTKNLMKYENDLKTHYAKDENGADIAEREFDEFLKEKYSNVADIAIENNDKRARFIYKARLCVVGSFAPLVASALTYTLRTLIGK